MEEIDEIFKNGEYTKCIMYNVYMGMCVCMCMRIICNLPCSVHRLFDCRHRLQ